MLKILFAVITGLIGAALLHLVIILALPQFTGRDAYTRVLMRGNINRFLPLSARPDDTGLGNGDPFLRVAVCSFDVDEMPVRLIGRGAVPFWSLVIYDSASNEVFSMNDRTSVSGAMDVVLASPIQLTGIRKTLPDALAQSILVEMPRPDGYAVVRTLVPRKSFEPAARDFLSDASCEPFTGR